MKKTIVSALTAALVVGAASTTFAASNPFSDVPAGHWAYDAVAQLAQDGVIDGYGDNTFQGDKNITRYEMAQMVAKAMAKTNNGANANAADKAALDKLAAEFHDELNNLGVRVANLEKNADQVKWNGTAEYTVARPHQDHQSGAADKAGNVNNVLFRLEPSAEINNNWHVNARLDANSNLATDTGADGKVDLKRVWAQGNYGAFTGKFGKFAPIDDDSIFDTQFSGAELSYNKGAWNVVAAAGRNNNSEDNATDVADYQYYGVGYTMGKLTAGADFHELQSKSLSDYFDGWSAYKKSGTTDQADIWLLKGSYTFDQNNALQGFYAENHDADAYEKAASVEYDYKGADRKNAGTWGAWLAYRHLGENAAAFSTFDAVDAGWKAWEIGANYAPFKNVVAQARYAKGKTLAGDTDVDKIWGRVNFFF
ncbi:MAG: S-layer homology domain-containing protein [Selenomonadaceae bacterium]|nr:S-layer homology domain-containing protein [Selenomonadaceae bacterium]